MERCAAFNNAMFKRISMFFLIALGIIGCGVQRGRYVTTGDSINPLLSPVGSIDIVDGYESKPAHETGMMNDQHLLYLFIITSGTQEHGSSSSSDYGKYITTLSHTWNTEKGILSVSTHWDRQADIVSVGKSEFNRAKGNVFVVRFSTNGEVSGQQLGNIGAHANCREVLNYVQQQLPDDAAISSVHLYK